MSHSLLRALSLVPILVVVAQADVVVDTCGQVVPARQTGVLAGDLDCTGAFEGVVLETRATLDLDGHVLSSDGTGSGVECDGRLCTVIGPGSIENFRFGVRSAAPNGPGRRKTGRIDVANVDFVGHEFGIRGFDRVRAHVTDSTVTGCDIGLAAFSAKAERVTARGNALAGLSASRRLVGIDIIAEDNGGTGVSAAVVRGTRLLVQRNGDLGVRAGQGMRLVDSTVIDNTDLDLSSARRPRLRDVTCGTSGGFVSTWGVCADH